MTDLRDAWYRFMRNWRVLHYSFGFVGTLCAVTVASNPKILASIPYMFDVMSWASAVAIGMLTMYRPHGRANAYAAAWRTLNHACNRYELDPEFAMENLLTASAKGEELIQGTDPTS